MSKKTSLYTYQKHQITPQLSTNKKSTQTNDITQPYKNTFATLATTQRKALTYDVETRIYMDQTTTPLKQQLTPKDYLISPQSYQQQVSSTSRYRQILLKLDDAQQKLVVSDKKYGQLWRKYQMSCETVKTLNKEISKLSQKPFDMQVKCNLLEREEQQYQKRLKSKEVEVQGLKNQFSDVKNKLRAAQEKLEDEEEVIEKLSQQVKEYKQVIKRLQSQQSKSKQCQTRSYQRIISSLKQQIEELHKELSTKTAQISALQKTISSSLQKQNQPQSSSSLYFQTQLSRLHKEKLSIVSSYQQKMTTLVQGHEGQLRKVQQEIRQELQREMNNLMEMKLEKEEISTQMMIERTKMNGIVQELRRENVQLRNKLGYYEQTVKQLEKQLDILIANTSKQQQSSICKSNSNNDNEVKELFSQLQSIKRQFSLLKQQLDQRQQQLTQQQQQNQHLLTAIHKLEQQLSLKQNQQLQTNQKSKTVSNQLLSKLNLIQTDRDQLQRQLLAQRLQSIKLKQQLQQQQQYLKRQYQLSLQNLKAELSQQIHSVNKEKQSQIVQKEKIYFQMKQLERKFQLLNSQILTVDDMMSIATKVHKRHSHYVRK